MPEAARLPYFGPIPPLLIGALIGASLIAAHGIGHIILVLIAVGIAMKWIYRWHGGTPTAWASCAGRWREQRRAWWAGRCGNGNSPAQEPGQIPEPPSSGNHAFDEYRREMLRRLEQDHKDFQAFLERLRQARDKTEFDQFMADRNRGNSGNGSNGTPPVPYPNA